MSVAVVARGHGPGAFCEICDTRLGDRVKRACGLEVWACGPCSGDDDSAEGEIWVPEKGMVPDENPNFFKVTEWVRFWA